MSDLKFVLSQEGIGPLLRSDEMKSIMEEKVRDIAGRAGVGYTTDSYVGKARVNVMAYPDSPYTCFSNLKHSTLLRAMRWLDSVCRKN